MAPSKILSDKWILITGASKGIGQAVAEAFAEQGASLMLVARSQDQLLETANGCKEKGAPAIEVHALDLTNPEAIENLSKQLLDKHKFIYGLVNNAGMMPGGNGPTDGDIRAWETALKLNVLAPMQWTRCLAPAMQQKREGLIINMGSVSSIEPDASNPVYVATKHALRGWSRSCYAAFRKDNIKVAHINPGMVETGMTEGRGDAEKMIKPSDIAEAALLAVRTSAHAVPTEITIRPVEPVA
ncbi:hypothetical protein WJX72_011991 [[Myrmecia] bisecta]|uniref:Uncharacterized protein n=1 Tax=[Myrmecia] bisecta TaxID=41462 RepID=A0AAW1QT46_9CHLO